MAASRGRFEQQLGLAGPSQPPKPAALPLLDCSWLPESHAFAGGQHVVTVTGTVRLGAGYPAVELFASHSAALHSRTHALAKSAASYAHGCPYALSPALATRPGGELTFHGSALQPSALAALVQHCSPHAIAAAAEEPSRSTTTPDPTPPPTSPPPTASKTAAAAVTKAQRAAIREAHLFDELPEGYCFNGLDYYDAFGDRCNEHPEMARFVAEWAAGQAEQKRAAGEEARKLEAGDGLVLLQVLLCSA
ncbi:MAG: hypothetical protein WDW38_003610 [Sanguina aurantia]